MPPDGLRDAGRALWVAILDDLDAVPADDDGGRWMLDAREVEVLTQACRQADVVAALDELLDTDGLVVPGSTGQPRLSAVVTEVRQARLALAKLLGELALPGDDGQPATAAQRRARAAAQARWGSR